MWSWIDLGQQFFRSRDVIDNRFASTTTFVGQERRCFCVRQCFLHPYPNQRSCAIRESSIDVLLSRSKVSHKCLPQLARLHAVLCQLRNAGISIIQSARCCSLIIQGFAKNTLSATRKRLTHIQGRRRNAATLILRPTLCSSRGRYQTVGQIYLGPEDPRACMALSDRTCNNLAKSVSTEFVIPLQTSRYQRNFDCKKPTRSRQHDN